MLNSTLSNTIQPKNNPVSVDHIPSLFKNAPFAFALLNPVNHRLVFTNSVFLDLLDWNSQDARFPFPNRERMKIPIRNFMQQWNRHLFIVENKGFSSFEWIMESESGHAKAICAEMWKVRSADLDLIGLRLADVTKTKKLLLEANKYIRIY